MGDIGKVDSNGNLFVTGRVKEKDSTWIILNHSSSFLISKIENSFQFHLNLNCLKDIIVLKNAKKINASQIEDLLMQCLETTGEICVKAKPNDNNYDDVHAFIYSRLISQKF